jgi:hypothetical protein
MPPPPSDGDGIDIVALTSTLPGGGIIIWGCAKPPGPTAGEGITMGMLPPCPVIGVGMGTCPEDGLGAMFICIIWPDGGAVPILGVLGVPRLAPMKGVEPAGAGDGMGMLVPAGITGPCGCGGAGSGFGIGIGDRMCPGVAKPAGGCCCVCPG